MGLKLSLEGVSYAYGVHKVLSDVTVADVAPGRVTAVIGPNAIYPSLRGSATVKSPFSFKESSVPLMVNLPRTSPTSPSSSFLEILPLQITVSEGLVMPLKRTLNCRSDSIPAQAVKH